MSVGTPIRVRGIGRIRPAGPQFAPIEAGCTSRRRGRSSRASATASGRRLSIDSAPTSTVTPPTSAQRELAADGGGGLQQHDLDLRRGTTDRGCRGQAGDAAADHDHAGGGVCPVRAGVTLPDSQGPGHRGQPEGTGSRALRHSRRQPGAAAPAHDGAHHEQHPAPRALLAAAWPCRAHRLQRRRLLGDEHACRTAAGRPPATGAGDRRAESRPRLRPTPRHRRRQPAVVATRGGVSRTGESSWPPRTSTGSATRSTTCCRAVGGSVDDEQTTNDRAADRRLALVLRVPVDRFDTARTPWSARHRR